MQNSDEPLWLKWAREIQAQSQNTLAFADNQYEVERGKKLAEIAAEILEHYADFDKAELLDNYLRQPGYACPKIDVRGVVARKGEILLVKEITDGKWALPGGWADVGDYPAGACEREVFEESGLQVKAHKIIAVFDANRIGRPIELYHAFKIIFLCHYVDGELAPSFETPDVGFFAFENLPPLSENRTNMKILNEVHAHLNDAQRPTFFE